MTPDEFVKGVHQEKESLLQSYFDPASGSIVAESIDNLGLSEDTLGQLRVLLDDALSEMCFSILLGLDGGSALGDRQELYRLYDENGVQLAGDGMNAEDDIESAAFRYFQDTEGEED